MYGLSEAALYLRVPIKTLEYWVVGQGSGKPIIKTAGQRPRALSFMNLLECHMLATMKKLYDLKLPRIRRAVADLSSHNGFKPLSSRRPYIRIGSIYFQKSSTSSSISPVRFLRSYLCILSASNGTKTLSNSILLYAREAPRNLN